VSHDRALLDRLTDYLFVFDGTGGIRGFTGNYEDYREAEKEEGASVGRPLAPRAAAPSPQKREKPGLSFRERKEYETLVSEIDGLEKEQKSLEEGFQRIVTDPAALQNDHRRYGEILKALDEKLARWEELAGKSGD
jgi:ATP-binding cassette subfamily F protein uup